MAVRRNVNIIKSLRSGDIIDLGLNGHNEYYIVAYQSVGGKYCLTSLQDGYTSVYGDSLSHIEDFLCGLGYEIVEDTETKEFEFSF